MLSFRSRRSRVGWHRSSVFVSLRRTSAYILTLCFAVRPQILVVYRVQHACLILQLSFATSLHISGWMAELTWVADYKPRQFACTYIATRPSRQTEWFSDLCIYSALCIAHSQELLVAVQSHVIIWKWSQKVDVVYPCVPALRCDHVSVERWLTVHWSFSRSFARRSVTVVVLCCTWPSSFW